jgi:hypothetical protein
VKSRVLVIFWFTIIQNARKIKVYRSQQGTEYRARLW